VVARGGKWAWCAHALGTSRLPRNINKDRASAASWAYARRDIGAAVSGLLAATVIRWTGTHALRQLRMLATATIFA